MFNIALSAQCADVVFRRDNNRADDIRPYMAYATKFPLGIQWNRPCRVVPLNYRADIS